MKPCHQESCEHFHEYDIHGPGIYLGGRRFMINSNLPPAQDLFTCGNCIYFDRFNLFVEKLKEGPE